MLVDFWAEDCVKCLKWKTPAVVGVRVEASVLWGDGILVSCWVEFGGV